MNKEEKLPNEMFQDVPANEREAMLDANCVKPEEMPIKKYFSPEETTQMRADYADGRIQIGRKMEELEKKKQEVKNFVKPIQDNCDYLINNIRTGYVEVNQQVYLFACQTSGMMNYYNNEGKLVYARTLAPHERQLRVPN